MSKYQNKSYEKENQELKDKLAKNTAKRQAKAIKILAYAGSILLVFVLSMLAGYRDAHPDEDMSIFYFTLFKSFGVGMLISIGLGIIITLGQIAMRKRS